VENYNMSLPLAPSGTILRICLVLTLAIFLHQDTQGCHKRDEGHLKRGKESFLKLGECMRHRDFFRLDQGSINYNINISSLLPLGLPVEVYLYISKLVFSVGKQLGHGL